MSVFISYSRRDTPYVDALTRLLTKAGHDVWIDRTGIGGGTEWRHEIVTAIEAAEAVVLVLSPDAVASRNVRKEVDVAESAERPIIPVLCAAVTLPAELKYQLSGVQMLDLPDLSGPGVDGLLAALGSAPLPAPGRKRQVADLASMDGGGLFSKLAGGLFSGRKRS
jgi:hypothetical protein